MATGKRNRGNGEGSIYQRGDGKWCASLTLEGGKRMDALLGVGG